jgi:glycosyltransferase involved in cell wall biosynthesis
LAPYEPTAFPNRQVAYSSLKIPEYMASARPVVSTPSGHVLKLIQHGVSGFLFPNDVPHWQEFLRTCPSQERLRRMGMAAARLVPTPSWEDVAHAYLTLCHLVMARSAQPQSMKAQLPA